MPKYRSASVPQVDSVSKALQILDCFTSSEAELALKELCIRTGLYKSRVHRLCATLLNAGYLVRSSRTDYCLGPKVLALGKTYEKTNSLRSVASFHMKQLAEETGESTVLYLLDNNKCICLAREMGASRLVFSINEGDYSEPTPTAAGRVLLAFSDPATVNRILAAAPKTQFTSRTKIKIEDIKKDLCQIRKDGYGIDDQELEDGIAAIAAPIFDYDNKLSAALAIAGPAYRFTPDYKKEVLSRLLHTAEKISRMLGNA